MPEIYGFELVREVEVAEWKSIARLYRHVKTGAQLMSVINDDENKAFAVSFSTPPSDSTGIAHILEHSVLCGSRKYPLKEPFIELVKGSLNTFLNAMTGAAETYYPVASTNERDFYNLVDVYFDAVFFPTLSPQILQQEGWHYELADKNDPLIYKGVVFNEMKGAYQMPNTVLFNYAARSLFPDHVYGVSSGGDPVKIPDLTFEQLSSFHKTYYHPSNALIWFWGNDNPEERLRLADSYLSEFERREVDSRIPIAAAFSAPKRFSHTFPAGADKDAQKAMLSLNWVLTDKIDVELDNALQILSYLLIGTPASALRKALVDSGLVEQVMGGVWSWRQRVYVIGMKGIPPGREDDVEKLALQTLHDLAEKDIPKDAVEAAYNAHEFSLREMNSGGFPRGLALAFSSLSSWIYGSDAFEPLCFEAPLARLRSRIEAGGFFEGLIRRLLLENNHRTTVAYQPDSELIVQAAQDERERLAAVRESMAEPDLERVVAETRALQEKQQTPDPEEALAKLPRLALGDLDRDVKRVPTELIEVGGCRTYYHDLF
ncbi:MAG TPA: insulinase family protein, partial [Capsulimonadaceae bacterium]|nr:insulinase family protein [Capsulimonadaceae bacterium]